MIEREWEWFTFLHDRLGGCQAYMMNLDDIGFEYKIRMSFEGGYQDISYQALVFTTGVIKFQPSAGSLSFPADFHDQIGEALYKPAKSRILAHTFYYLQQFDAGNRIVKMWDKR